MYTGPHIYHLQYYILVLVIYVACRVNYGNRTQYSPVHPK